MYYAAAIQVDQPNPTTRAEMTRNTSQMLALLERTVIGYRPFHDIRLIVFPEFAHAAPVYETADELRDKLALPADNEHIERLTAKAAELNVYIQSGSFLEVDERWPEAVFNTTCLIGPNGVLSRYRKVNPWIPWEVHTSPHDIPDYPDDAFPVVETELGKLGVATCYDWLFPEVTRELALRGAEVLIRISAYMDPWGATPPTDWWTVVNRCRALENLCYVVAANQGASSGRYPPFTWPGGSMIVDYDGRILAEAPAGPGERVVVAPIHLDALREERARRLGHVMPAHLRSELYTSQRGEHYRGNRNPQHRTVEQLGQSITEQKQRWLGLSPE